MRITESQLRRIIREAISEDLNEGIFGDFVDTFGQEDYKKYKMMLQLCEKLFENLNEDKRFSLYNWYIDDKSMKNVLSGSLKLMRYTYSVTSEISNDISNLMLNFKAKYGGYSDFVVNVPLESGKNRFLNRPNFETDEVINIGDHIHEAFLSAMDKREKDIERSRQANIDREAAKAQRAKELGIERLKNY